MPGSLGAAALRYARAHRDRFLDELQELVRFPSVSAQPCHAGDVRRCAGWLAGHLRQIGLDRARVVPTAGHPLVFAEWRRRPDRPTLLLYGHYDVQPVDPLSEWRSPPFEPHVCGADLHGRGASDDKGQLFAHLKAIESLLRTRGELPVNVRCLLDGEEEVGSPNLAPFLERNRRALAADAAIISDTAIPAPDRPAITYGLRGGLSLELVVEGPAQDLHSGTYGGAVHNPLQALCELVGGLHDAAGRVAIPGFYASVRTASEAERRALARAGPPDEEVLRNAGARRGWGERGFTAYERTTIRPALTVNGITGGYQGTGGKGVIPSRATAKLSFRLVPDQDPRQVEALFRRHVARVAPSTVRVSVRTGGMASPVLLSRRHPAVEACARAYARGFGRAPVFLRSGGTVAVARLLQERMGVPVVLMGFGLPDDRIHAPNEKFHLPNFYRAIDACIWLLHEAAAIRPVRGDAALQGQRGRAQLARAV